MNGLAMLAKQIAPSLDIPGLLVQFETLKKELPKFARGVKETVEKTDARLAAIESELNNIAAKQNQLLDLILQVIAAPSDPNIYPAGPSRIPDIPANDGAAI